MTKLTFIAFDGTNHDVEADAGISVMEAARNQDIPGIEAECGGACSCATCHVIIEQNWLAITGPATGIEHDLLGMTEDFQEGSRLSCQIDITDAMDGMIVHIPKSQIY